VLAQQQSVADVPTPNAASLGEYGQIPVNFFNGLPSISVPIHKFQYKKISIPLSLDYHAGGNRTENVPGWVGLGWNLSAGGAVTRIVNGIPDEIETNDLNIGMGAPYPTNQSYGYFYQSGVDNLSWNKADLDNSQIQTANTMANSYGRAPYDGEADEFMFNAGDLSGSFFLIRKQDGSLTVKVKAKTGEPLKVEATVSSGAISVPIYQDATLNNGAPAPGGKKTQASSNRAFLGFEITRADGTKYTFGTTTPNAAGTPGPSLTAIDFNIEPKGAETFKALATSWYLTKITSPEGYAVNLEYKKYGDVFVRRAEQYIALYYINNDPDGTCYHCNDPRENIRYILQHPSYLTRIAAPDGTGIEFKSSPSTQLNFNHAGPELQKQFYWSGWDQSIALSSSKWLQLDSIRIKGLRKIRFNYSNVATRRLRLLGLTVSSLRNTEPFNYSFSYNQTDLPPYNSYQSDNWGYYNAKSPYSAYITTNGFTDLASYRTANSAAMKAESLEKITYPTGGETSFFYEPHEYSKYVSNDPSFGTLASTPNTIAGGLRIQRIESRTSATDPNPQIWSYEYVNTDNSSSGILSGIPTYNISGKLHVDINYCHNCSVALCIVKVFCPWTVDAEYNEIYNISSDNPQVPLSTTNGSHVTYSRVIERRPKNGFTVYTYTDHILFPDEAPISFVFNTETMMLNTPFTSRELERGLLLSTSVYDEGNRLLKTVVNEYNNDPARYNDFVRMQHFGVVPGGKNYLVQVSAHKVYTFYPYLKQRTETNYGAGSTPVVSTTSYQYNSYRLLSEENSTDSGGKALRTTYRYAPDLTYSGPNPSISTTQGILLSVNRNLLTKPIETVQYRNGAVIGGTVTLPSYTNGSFVAPYQVYELETDQPIAAAQYTNVFFPSGSSNFIPPVLDQKYKLRQTFNGYDASGNVLSVVKPDQGPMSFLWDYDKTLPVAIATNAAPNQIAYTGFESDPNGQFVGNSYVNFNPNNWDYDPRPGYFVHLQATGGFTGRGCYRLDGGWGVGRNNLPEGDYEVSFWAKGGIANISVFATQELSRYEGPANTNALDYRLIRVRVHVAAGSGVTLDAYGRQVDIDDVRLYPIGAQMTTYTHIPQVGVASTSDANNQPTRYEYDGLQRLRLVRDPQGNLVKELNYHYQQ